SKWASTIVMLAFILLIMGVVYYFAGNSYVNKGGSNKEVNPNDKITDKRLPEQHMQSAGPNDTANSGESLPKEEDPPPPPENEPVLTYTHTVNNVDHYTVSHIEKINVTLEVTGEECWLQIDKIIPATEERKAERQVIEQKLYKKGDTRNWVSDQSVYMTVGLPPAAKVAVNGIPLEFEYKGKPKYIQINLEKTEL